MTKWRTDVLDVLNNTLVRSVTLGLCRLLPQYTRTISNQQHISEQRTMADQTDFMTVLDTTQVDTNPSSSRYSALNGSTDVDPFDTNRRPAFDAIDLFVTPVWYLLGIPGNIIAYVVWIQRRMRPSSGCYLAALALDECVFLILQVIIMQHYYSINHSGYFYGTYSSPLLLGGAPDIALILCRS